jgi:Ca2+-binding RTX toxin-like protein
MAKYTGTNGNDNKISGSEADLVLGLLGDDTLDGSTNRDTIDGGGGNDSLIGGSQADSLLGGLGADTLDGGGDRDTMDGGLDDDKLLGGDRNDSLIGGDGNDTLDGGAWQDALLGGKGNDSLLGGDGFDSLDGGLGDDTMNGGAGADGYIVDSAGDTANDSGTEIGDFVQATVSVNLATGPFAGIEHVTLLGKAAIDAAGNGVSNRLTGNAGANKLDGAAGLDTLDGGAGADTMNGGAGVDTYTADALDVINDSGVDAEDRVRGAFAIDLTSTKLAGIEHATLTGLAALTIAGDENKNMLIGNAGANTLAGGANADTLIGGDGNDTYSYEAGDVVIEYAGGGVDQINAATTVNLAGLNVENLQLTGAANVSGNGNALANKLVANSGNTSLFGLDGNDTLIGGTGDNILSGDAGNDSLAGGDGNDFYVVDGLGDKVSETGTKNSNSDELTSMVDYKLGANIEGLNLSGTALTGIGNSLGNTINGNAQNNVLIGAAGADTIDGIFGSDVMQGGDGNDQIFLAEDADTVAGGAGKDTFDFKFADATDDIILDFEMTRSGAMLDQRGGDLLDVSGYIGFAGTPFVGDPAKYVSVIATSGGTLIALDKDGAGPGAAEIVGALLGVSTDLDGLIANGVLKLGSDDPVVAPALLGGKAGDNLAGTVKSDWIAGAAGNDTLSGGSGFDTLDGGAGADKMDGGLGGDAYVVDNKGDSITDAGGSDDRILSALSIDLNKYAGIEHATLAGKAAGNLTGTDGVNNMLLGNAAANVLDGKTGTDILAGGGGNDTYIVDNSADAAFELAEGGTDQVKASASYSLAAFVENLTLLAAAGSATGIGNELANKIAGNDFDNSLTGNGGKDLLSGAKGDDHLSGGEDADTLIGGDGKDNIDGGFGADSMSGGKGDDLYIVDSAGDKIADSGGTESIISFIDFVLAPNLENLQLFGSGLLKGTGNAAANVIFGSNDENLLSGLAGNDSLNGDDGNDTLLGGLGNDTLNGFFDHDLLVGGAGKDRFVIDKIFVNSDVIGDLEVSHLGGDIIDLNAALPDAIPGGSSIADYIRVTATNGSTLIEVDLDGAGGGEVFRDAVSVTGVVFDASALIRWGIADLGPIGSTPEIELGTAAKDNLDTAFSGVAFGAGGNDSIFGSGGAEWLDGGAGADTLRGTVGDDTYVVDSLLDLIIETGVADDNDMVRGSISIDLRDDARYINIEHAALTGMAALKLNGDEQNNFLGGNAGANVIDGGSGSDTMAGGAGNDTYLVSGNNDTIIEYAGGGIDSVRSVGDFTLDDEVENLTLLGALDYDGAGNDLGNKITGNGGLNKLEGFGGNDTLTGGDGSDTLDGGAGADLMTGGNGLDTYVVDNIGDKIVETGTISSSSDQVQSFIDYTLGNGLESLRLMGTGNLQGTGNAARNVMFGNDGDNTLSGLGGDDGLLGGEGDDLLIGGDGRDGLCFGNGMETLIGGAGADFYQRGIATVTEGDAADLIVGFEIGAGGDVVDLSDFFADPVVAADVLANPNDYLQTQMVDGSTVIRIDLDGTGGASAFFDLCVLQGVSTDLNGLLSEGNLIPATPEILIPI